MTANATETLATALREPETLLEQELGTWESVVVHARRTNLLGCLSARLVDAGLLFDIPPAPRAHVQSAEVVSQAEVRSVRRELGHLRDALRDTVSDVVLLKGSAYLLAGLPAARGRAFGDIDILVPHARLADVEAALMLAGWATTHLNDYDQRYYRTWMHELPPMRHVTRGTVLDVHHAILPRTARSHPDSRKLLEDARVVAGEPLFKVLAPADMVLHSATHLFYNDDLSNGLRDLVDLDSLLRAFGRDPAFWTRLVARGSELELARPLHYALRYARRILKTPIPVDVEAAAARAAGGAHVLPIMDFLYARALRPDAPRSGGGLARFVDSMLYVRGHWLRMPPLLLVRHLMVKALRRKSAAESGGI